MIPIALGLHLQAGEVRARAWLRIALAPPDVGAQDRRQVLLLLRIGAKGHNDWRNHFQAHGRGRRHPGQRHFHVENIVLRRGPGRAAILGRPAGRNPALFSQLFLPLYLASLVQIAVLGLGHLAAQVGVIGLFNPGPDLIAKGKFFGGKSQIHSDYSTASRYSTTGAPAMVGPILAPAALK